MKVMIMMPAIYRLAELDNLSALSVAKGQEKALDWGWHRATELFEAVNSVLVSRGKWEMSSTEIASVYNDVHPWGVTSGLEGLLCRSEYLVVDQSGCVRKIWTQRGEESGWLKSAIDQDLYLPAKVGMELIAAVKGSVNK